TDTDWKEVNAGGYDHSVAIKTNGTLWAWGRNFSGALGDGTDVSRNAPAQVGIDTDWKIITASHYSNLAIKTNGTLWAWGRNNNGELGSGNRAHKLEPTQIGTETN